MSAHNGYMCTDDGKPKTIIYSKGEFKMNKYWENEVAVETETSMAVVKYYKDAGKVQLFPTYLDKNNETQLGRGCTWDNNEMSSEDAVKLAFAVMQGLLDSGIENDAYSEAYSLLSDEIEKLGKKSKSKTSKAKTKKHIDKKDANSRKQLKMKFKQFTLMIEVDDYNYGMPTYKVVSDDENIALNCNTLINYLVSVDLNKKITREMKKELKAWADDEIDMIFDALKNSETTLDEAIKDTLKNVDMYEF